MGSCVIPTRTDRSGSDGASAARLQSHRELAVPSGTPRSGARRRVPHVAPALMALGFLLAVVVGWVSPALGVVRGERAPGLPAGCCQAVSLAGMLTRDRRRRRGDPGTDVASESEPQPAECPVGYLPCCIGVRRRTACAGYSKSVRLQRGCNRQAHGALGRLACRDVVARRCRSRKRTATACSSCLSSNACCHSFPSGTHSMRRRTRSARPGRNGQSGGSSNSTRASCSRLRRTTGRSPSSALSMSQKTFSAGLVTTLKDLSAPGRRVHPPRRHPVSEQGRADLPGRP